MMGHFTYHAEWSADDGEWVGLCAEFPSLSWLAPSATEAVSGIEDVVGAAVADLTASGEDVPEPLSEQRYDGEVHIRITPDLHRRLTIEAAEQGVSLNQWVVERLSAR